MPYSCLEGAAVKALVLLLPTLTSPAHTYIYIPNLASSIQIPRSQGPWLRHLSTFTQYFSTTNPSLSLPLPGPWVHKEAGAFCSGLFEMYVIHLPETFQNMYINNLNAQQ